MHKHIIHNKCHATFAGVSIAILTFLREPVPRNWRLYCDEAMDNFRIISLKDFPILAGAEYIHAVEAENFSPFAFHRSQ